MYIFVDDYPKNNSIFAFSFWPIWTEQLTYSSYIVEFQSLQIIFFFYNLQIESFYMLLGKFTYFASLLHAVNVNRFKIRGNTKLELFNDSSFFVKRVLSKMSPGAFY